MLPLLPYSRENLSWLHLSLISLSKINRLINHLANWSEIEEKGERQVVGFRKLSVGEEGSWPKL